MISAAVSDAGTDRSRRHGGRLLAALLLVPVLLLVLAAAAVAATPGTMRLTDMTPTLGRGIAIAAPGGGTFTADPGHAVARIVPAGGPFMDISVWCVDARRGVKEGHTYDVTLQTAADAPEMAGPGWLETAWLIGRADAMIAAAPDQGREAAAIQIAIWQLTDQAADVPDVTADAALNARIAEIRALAAGHRPATAIALTGPAAPVAAGAASPVTVTGDPGTEVTLTVTSGTATLSAGTLTLDAAGRGDVTVTPTAPGEVVIGAAATGGVLWRAAHLPIQRAPQDMAYVVPTALTASTALTAVAPVTPETPQTPPSVTPSGTPRATLGLAKTAPRRVLTGVPITYTLTVRNLSGRTATAVVLRDALPSGTVAMRLPKGASLNRGAVVWRLGDLAPHAKVTVRIRLRPLRAAGSVIRNTAQASASNAATVRARALTRIAPLPAAAQPAVTG